MNFSKKFLLVATLLSTAGLHAANRESGPAGSIKPIAYAEIGDKYLSSFGLIEDQSSSEIAIEEKDKKPDLCLHELSDHEKRQFIFEILDKQLPVKDKNQAKFDDALRILLADLDVYYGQGKDSKETLMNKIDLTTTTFGQVALAGMLAKPTANIETIKKRQALIKELVNNPKLLHELESILNTVKKSESGFLSYWRQADSITDKAIKDLYFARFGLSKFNKNPYILESYVRLGNLNSGFKLTSDFLTITGFNYIMLKIAHIAQRQAAALDPNFRAIPLPQASLKEACKSTWQTLKQFYSPYEYTDAIRQLNNDLNNPLRNYSDQEKKIARGVTYSILGLRAGLAAFLVFHKANTAKAVISEHNQVKDAINFLQTRLIDVATIVNTSKKIKSIAHHHQNLKEGLSSYNALEKLFGDQNAEFAQLISLLQSKTFTGSASFFSQSGKVLAAHSLMTDHKDKFAPAIEALGQLDACVSIAKLICMMQSERVGYCFVDFVKSENPSLNVTDFWNPFINPELVVTNSLSMGGHDASKIILTGSNTAGKSTILKAVMMSILFAQTFGIAPAQSCTMTPFDFIGSYLRVNDDVASGESKFKAEVLRAKMICQTLESLTPDQKAFAVMDELFTGTNSTAASEAGQKVALKLAGFNNTLYILATHFKSLTNLESENSNIKNYKIDVYKADSGNLVRPFKLEPGISSSNVANDLLNEEISSIDF